MKKTLSIAAGMAVLVAASHAQVLFSGSYSQNFDTLPSTGTTAAWADNSTLSGWYFARQAGAATTININPGSSTAGGLHSFGAAASTERALGSIGSGTPVVVFFGVQLRNNTANTLNSVTVNFTQETWRNSTSQVNTSAFSWKVGAAGLNEAGYTNNTLLDLVGPAPVTTNGALDGNLAANQIARSATFAVTWAPGTDLWLRWVDTDNTGSDAGLAIDGFSVQAVPEPATLAALGLGAAALLRRRRK